MNGKAKSVRSFIMKYTRALEGLPQDLFVRWGYYKTCPTRRLVFRGD